MATLPEQILHRDPDPETSVLLRAARLTPGEEEREQLRRSLTGDLDWEHLYALALRHKVAPVLHVRLQEFADLVPTEVLRRLAHEFLVNAGYVLEISRELVTIIRSLEAIGVPCVPYKGPALAAQVYGNIALRPVGDLDVVVRKRDLPKVRELLRSRGFQTEHALAGAGDEKMVRTLYHEQFLRSDNCMVEVHWAFTDKNLAFSLDLETLEPRLEPLSLGGEKVLGFSREDLLLILCVHGAKHRWARLEWIMGVSEILRGPQPIDWTTVLQRADELRSRRVLLLGVMLARELLDAPLPEFLIQSASRDPVMQRLTVESKLLLFNPSEHWKQLDVAPRDVFYLRLGDRWRDRARYLARRLTTPSQAKSWRGVPLGRVYIPLHALVRPFSSFRILRLTARWLVRRRPGSAPGA